MLTESAFWVLMSLVILFGVMVSIVGWFAVRSYIRQSSERAKLVSGKSTAPIPAEISSPEVSSGVLPSLEAQRLSSPQLSLPTEKKNLVSEPNLILDKPVNKPLMGLSFWQRLKGVFPSQGSKQEQIEVIEEVLYTADLGPTIVEGLLAEIEDEPFASLEDLKGIVKKNLLSVIDSAQSTLPVAQIKTGEAPASSANQLLSMMSQVSDGPFVLLIVGVNGAGKTTTIGKLAQLAASQGKKVLVAAGDTFRAAASGQLRVWAERAQVEIFSPPGVSDPGAVAFDAIQKGKAQAFDLVIIDTAGRLHTQSSLMAELEKVKRVMQKADSSCPHGTWIVLDANTGQNGVLQAREFSKALGLTGAVLTKMDGTAKGGVVFAVAKELGIPILFLGVGEKQADLVSFIPQEFVDQIFQS